MDKEVKEIVEQDTELAIKLFQKRFGKKETLAGLFIKNNLACSFFRVE